jgi:dipeptidyl aminopeptidase/acylaminoacyl peptidase
MRKDLSIKVILISLAFLAGAQGSFSQTRPENPIAPYQGTYRFESGELILISRGGVIDEVARPYFLDWQTGRHGTLTAKDEGVFVSTTVPAAKSNVPVDTEILFRRDEDGKIESLIIRDSGCAERKAVRVVLYEDEDTSFMNGDVKLAATLRRPKIEDPVPAIVLVYGSGPGDRAQMNDMNSFLASLGLAVLTYDKRGCGASGGDWKKVDIDVLAQDALAGVRWLKAQPGIDPLRVGLYGFSQGGWITTPGGEPVKERDS